MTGQIEPARVSLNGNDWLFKDYIGEDWLMRRSFRPGTRDILGWRSGSVPGCPVNDLWALGEIPNPYFERNSLLLEWIPERAWVYKKVFQIGEEHQNQRAYLHFKGVDYAAQFYLNGEMLGEHTGMYTPVTFEVTGKLRFGEENLLAVLIEPAPPEQPQVGRTSQVTTFKSRMTYWWDFCPRMVHTGIWDDVYLELCGPVRIEDVFVRPQLNPDFERAEVQISSLLDSFGYAQAEIETVITLDNLVIASQRRHQTLEAGKNQVQTSLAVDNPQLWWPNGYGQQPLYQVEVKVWVSTEGEGSQGGRQPTLSATRSVSFGIRDIQLVQNAGAEQGARPYTFVVNGRLIYAKGWNWVPIDVLYSVPRPEKLSRLMELARRAHVNLLRVWGGGLIEKDAFYEQCDRLGIMVWQEFILSSSGIDNTPSTAPDYLELLKSSAEQIIPLKRNHPSLALWCGGNELQSAEGQPLDDTFPALAVLKSAVEHLDPGRLWLPTSPSGRAFGNSLEAIERDPAAHHDVHGPWEYQGVSKQYELYNRGASLLHSEFGVEGITNQRALDAVIAPEHQQPVSLDNPYWFHLGAWWVKRPDWDLAFGALADVRTLQRATQFMQFDGLRYAVEADRRRKFHNSGSLPWQFNESYPMAACTSAVDYYTHPKPAYYAVAHAYEPVHVSACFPTLAWQDRNQFEALVYACSSLEKQFTGASLEWRLVGASGKVYAQQSRQVDIPANKAELLVRVNYLLVDLTEQVFFLDLRLQEAGGGLLSANRYIFSRQANLAPLFSLPETALSVEIIKRAEIWEVCLTNTGERAALWVWLEDGRLLNASGSVFFDSNYFCLFPKETRTITCEWRDAAEAARLIEIKGWNTASQAA